ncbi:MAG: T9SS type A sorting domain-containing protein, partial [Bacteroidota bacterium]
DIQADGILIAGSSGTITNSGLIRKTTTTGESGLSFVDLENAGGTIQVESGTFSFTQGNPKSFTGGTINVFPGATFDIDSPTPLSGTIEGQVDGDLIFDAIISVTETAVINFTGDGNVNSLQNIIQGGGTLANQGNFNIVGATILQEGTTVNNSGVINLMSGSGLSIPDGTINNEVTGVIDLNSNSSTSITPGFGTEIGLINNAGLLRKTTSGNQNISVDVVNTGTIDVVMGELSMNQSGGRNFINAPTGIVKGNGTFNLPPTTNYTNEGTFAPGASPGTLLVVGDFESTASSVLEIELDGPTQGSEYDLLAISGNADLDGELQVILNYEAGLNDAFTIATTTGSINNCNLPTTVTSNFDGATYQISVDCVNGNELALNVTDILLSTQQEELEQVNIYPNPSQGVVFVNGTDISKITVFDIEGRRVLETKRIEVDIEHLENGVYLMEIIDKDGLRGVRRVVKF